jgi:signal transduction histidine kinase
VAAAAVALAGLGYGLGALAVARGSGAETTYAGTWRVAAALGVAAGLGLVAAGLVSWSARPAGRVGALAVVAGIAWFAPFFVGWEGGPPVVRSLGMAVAGFAFAFLCHLVLAFPGGRVRSGWERALVLAVYGEALLSALGRALFRDPFLDLHCWDNCTDNVFLIHASPGLAATIRSLDLWFGLASGAALAVVCIGRLATATPTARRTLGVVLAGGVVLGAAAVAHTIALERVSLEDPFARSFRSAFVAACTGALLVATGLGWSVVRVATQRRAVARIVAELGEAPEPGSLEHALARAVGDPELRIAYWLPASQRYADAEGAPSDVSGPGTITPLIHHGNRVAVVVYGGDVAELEQALGPAARLALENERLRAEVLAQIVDLRASRARIVEAGDSERRRLERNLHDGAQQRLLALSYDIRLARSAAEGSEAAMALLDRASSSASTALEDLRDLASGIYPAILAEAGLGPALETLADTAAVPIELAVPDGVRFPLGVETAAYFTVVQALGEAAERGASYASVSIGDGGGKLVVQVDDDGASRTCEPTRIADRVGALGGTLELGTTKLTAEIPVA